jgi:hypothetical protein
MVDRVKVLFVNGGIAVRLVVPVFRMGGRSLAIAEELVELVLGRRHDELTGR